MKIEFEGRTWALDTSDVDMKQAEVITGFTGLTLSGWEKACMDHEGTGWLKAIGCLYWLMLAQNGETVAVDSVNFAVLKFFLAWAEAVSAEAGAAGEGEPDPTKPAGEPGGELAAPVTEPSQSG